MALSEQRSFTTAAAGEDWPALAKRVLPGEDAEAAVQKLQSWNLHLFARRPPGSFLGSDVIFVEPPREPGNQTFGGINPRRDSEE